ncbi:DNA-directed RNA polymerase subunit beta [Bifidobacterium psychraerophilum]|uniref:DNA-directed RNA polymerase subunit beta n=2 Tax=Bifidobacterium psychraerophilum TaxID=218140 RepID=A0A087CBX4_9BIFI|nr:DNA-directed RNA polymerase subunit beta [Bifidobacterium psychraerophilum]KFI80774.1 DNA-directed RNA polymerase, beta subunit [Bifidobacterium psychraerophilum]MCI1660741.1 DNA-directed RNA polymerase subunit beta [Bifidobacterium psychraerophilum]MCI1805350.1 DNA-directed RNA polymerase subunit beta [Bifidobacterium psychraerophilum]MCI2176905.1 DNA-directed RNA polymerase subunit beta [Bifidobacterium psychraerophilum]MCI2183011.1 DNA-directed RNA polymerase subunit beta [Bifidobacteriu
MAANKAARNTTQTYARADEEDIKLHKAPNRVNFGSIQEPLDVPYLLGVQTDSFDWLIGNERWKQRVEEDERDGTNTVAHISGLDEVFKEISPIENFAQTMSLAFSDPYFEEPRHTVLECKEKDYTYSAPLYVNAEFENGDTGEIKSQTVFMGDFPLQTPHGTFIIGGTERVIVSQLVRSPGVYFDRNRDRTTDKEVFGAKIIPSRGAWLEFEIDKRDVLGVRVDRKRKQSAIVFLEAIGMTKSEIKESFQGYPLVLDALEKESIDNQDAALTDLYRKIRPSDTATPEAGRNLLDSFYFNTKRYDLARVGRYKINRKLGLEADFNDRSLNRDDIIATIKYLVTLHAGDKTFPGSRNGEAVDLRVDVDDIDHFGNRRIRQVGELIQNQLRTGLSRMERVVRERMTTQDAEAITPQSLINIRPVNATIKEFFGTSQLSQFMDQNNPLAGVTNKRRLSALGPGGLSRDRASMEVRDVHPSHFGRMCPIESPEGPNIGLIGSLATFGRINPFGFIETPYRKVDNGQLTDEITYMTADQETEHVIAQANQIIDEKGHLVESTALVRDSEGEAEDVPVEQVDYMDVSPRQMVSLGASLIPFLEHDEGHRALMGTNMQRQAVPLIKSERPLVGTGSEWRAAVDSGDVILSDKPGVVTYVSGDIIRVLNDDGTQSSYKLSKFQRSNQTTCYNQVPTIKDGERVEAGSVLADGPATQNGEMALGKNLLVAFMPWNGYNYEDAVIISQRLVQDDTLSSIHIEEYEIDARETKLGSEEITRDLPNVGEDAVANLDERGVIRIGAEVEAGDILVGKVTPKGETELTPEERLLRAIFGEKSREVRDTSLRVPHGETGTVIAVKEISREDAEEDGDELPNGVNQMIRVYIAQHRKITQGDKLSGRHGNKGVISRILPEEDMPFLPDGTPIDIMLNPLGVPSRMNLGQVLELHLGWIAHAGWDINLDPNLEAEWKKHIPAGAEKADPDTPVASPVFDGVRQDALHGLLKTTLPNRDGEHLVGDHGKAVLYDGRTGEPFTKPISVGYMYMLKLHHLVDDKIHARSTGPYSMITQQPLGGKAQFGGQRFGEMEVWALEAYGAAYTLHEMMTTKSDDVDGRVRVYGAIVKGDNLPPAGIPESFKVLLKEMQSLSLNVEVLNAEGVAIDMKDEDDDPASASDDLGFNINARPDAGAAMSSNDSQPEYR